MNRLMRVVRVAALILWTAAAARAASTSSEVFINYMPACDQPAQRLDLGTMSVSLNDAGNGTNATMLGDFTVSAAAQSSGIWNCMSLHYFQQIDSDACPATYFGNPLPTAGHKVADPPKGGWDYMYNGPNRTGGVNPKYDQFITQTPSYYNELGEAANFVTCKSYHIGDGPGYCMTPNNGLTMWTTYLYASVTADPCNNPAVCLQPGEMLLLAAWDWSIQKDFTTGTATLHLSTIGAPGAGDTFSVADAIAQGGYSGFTPVVDKAVCCPEPSCLLMFAVGLAALVPPLWRHPRRAA